MSLADHVVLNSKPEWCAAGNHRVANTVCVFCDPGDCEVHICLDCAYEIAAIRPHPSPEQKT